MRTFYPFLLLLIIVASSCTKNNQNSPSQFAYLNVEQTFAAHRSAIMQNYDIDNDGVIDWGFVYQGNNVNYVSLAAVCLINYAYNGNPTPTYLIDTLDLANQVVKTPSYGFNISNTNYFLPAHGQVGGWLNSLIFSSGGGAGINAHLAGTGDFYIGFKSQNPTFTNTFFGWARLNLSADGYTLIVRDMALNTVNGGSINVGQH